MDNNKLASYISQKKHIRLKEILTINKDRVVTDNEVRGVVMNHLLKNNAIKQKAV